MKINIISSLCLSLCMFYSCTTADINRTLGTLSSGLTDGEIGLALKQALEFGISEGANKLSLTNGYFKSPYKIFLPPEALKVTEKLSVIPGWSSVENTITEKLNRAAEDAAKKAAPIFVDAIKAMTFDDAKNILLGADNAATLYLQNKTFKALYDQFQPVILNSLNKFGAVDYWGDAVNSYNKIPFAQKLNPRLDDYVAERALDGLFSVVEIKEKGIRSDVSQRTTSLLKKVFARQD